MKDRLWDLLTGPNGTLRARWVFFVGQAMGKRGQRFHGAAHLTCWINTNEFREVGMSMFRRLQLFHRKTVMVFLIGALSGGSGLLAQVSPAKGQSIFLPFQYAAKFICGKTDGKAVAPGIYFTAVNVHNPTYKAIRFRKKFAIALPGERPGPVSKFFDAKLGPDQALEIDCPDIFKRTQTKGFVKGFVVIQSPVQLDVVSVYTALGDTGVVRTLHIATVQPRRVATCPDLTVVTIEKPTWDGQNRRSVIKASIRNIGNVQATATIARVIDPTTSQPPPSGLPYNDVVSTPVLMAGELTTVTFYLPYWVYNPDVTLEVTADYKGQLSECREDNNTKVFEGIG